MDGLEERADEGRLEVGQRVRGHVRQVAAEARGRLPVRASPAGVSPRITTAEPTPLVLPQVTPMRTGCIEARVQKRSSVSVAPKPEPT